MNEHERGEGISRRGVLSLAAVAATGSLAGCLGSSDDETGDGPNGDDANGERPPPGDGVDVPNGESFPQPEAPIPQRITAELVTGELEQTTQMQFAPGEGFSYVLERPGRVRVLTDDGLVTEPALDISDDVQYGADFETGLLGIELHPEFQTNRRLFIRYSALPREGTGDEFTHTFVLSEFEATADGREILAESERTVMEIPQPTERHQSGVINFGPDGYLYVPTGDGGARPGEGSETHPGYVEDWYDVNWGGHGQNTTESLLSGVLRIDVDSTPTEHHRTDEEGPDSPEDDSGYAIPSENPLVEWEGHRDEYFAWGFRNPWRGTFHEGEYFVADVGEVGWEAIYHVSKGGNYGWNVREGSHCFFYDQSDATEECPDSTPDDVRGGEALRDPIVEYEWGEAEPGEVSGIAVIGGRFYRGSAIPGLYGRYVFGDFFPTPDGSLVDSQLFVATPPAGPVNEPWEAETVALETLDDPPERLDPIHSFATDEDGELYIITRNSIWRVQPAQ